MSPTHPTQAGGITRRLRCLPLLGMLAFLLSPCGVAADPQRLEIPKAAWEPIFFETIDSVANGVGLTSLRRETMQGDDVETRVWIGYILGRRSGRWGAQTVEYRADSREYVRRTRVRSGTSSSPAGSCGSETTPSYRPAPRTRMGRPTSSSSPTGNAIERTWWPIPGCSPRPSRGASSPSTRLFGRRCALRIDSPGRLA
jgi:hypothetical protein